ncbi:Cysteine desulfurase IscS 2 [Candidatus Lokiarchaeum ossiferum]|uniref:cysteine desulfurase n=1 Tax=Candidatus Lokiarchaeum ossiferum TaxID=2951803 RepID=A0ABY6HPF6_9ARCH|nr:Cysteine desulfurase IscS 2 [Candidatus Lokiarchaeum sp. B-35]
MEDKIYLDNAATTRCHEDVLKEMIPYFTDIYGNASSLHTMGQEARKIIENARARIAKYLNANPNEIIFTGSGTESDNIAILGTARKLKSRGNHLITSNIEHPAVRNTFHHLQREGFEITEVPISPNGTVSVKDVEDAIRPETIFISIMYANNEIGSIQPIEEIAKLADDRDIIFHTDAVQALGKLRLDLKNSHIHLLSASAHKIMGPKGVGLLYFKNKCRHPKLGKFLEPITYGGGHEGGYRSATENVPGIVGFAKAIEIAYNDLEAEQTREKKIRDDFITWVLTNIPESYLNGSQENRLANNINLGFRYIEGESLLLYLNDEGFEVSTGSACSSHSLEPSHVLLALGLEKAEAHGSLRITLGRDVNQADMNNLKPVLKQVVENLRKLSPLAPH